MSIQQITIVGTGLIGGSLGLAIKTTASAVRRIGFDRTEVLHKAVAKRAIDAGEANLEKAIRGSQVVVLALPIGDIIDCIERLGPILDNEALITDVGSTKVDIAKRARAVWGADAKRRFLPGHPIAGREHSGIEFADANLFRGVPWLFIADAENQLTERQRDFVAVVRKIGAHAAFLSAERHDLLTAWISHLPQMLSVALASAMAEELTDSDELTKIGGGGMRDMTRLASSPYAIWRDIALTNSSNIEFALEKLEHKIAAIRENLKTPELRDEFAAANRFAAKQRS